MEGKTVILSVLIMSLVMAQIQVEAKLKSCCPTTTARNIYNACRLTPASQQFCANLAGCTLVDDGPCPRNSPNDILLNTGEVVNQFCKLGCASSMCGALTNLQNSGANEILDGAVEQCSVACTNICTKGTSDALESA